MFTPLILALMTAATTGARDAIVVVDDEPRIVIPLADYDLGRADGLRLVRQRIVNAATRVCYSGYREAIYPERVACVKSAVAGANAQLGALLTHHSTSVTAAIAVVAPTD